MFIDQTKAPFPWFGGKSLVSDLIWDKFSGIVNYVEPFAGSLAVLLGGPTNITRTVNDKDGFICNFWRAIASDPDLVASHADWPVNENDLHARHIYLVQKKEDLVARLEGDPSFYDAKIAGWWVWGICSWIATGWCSGNGPWSSVDGLLLKHGGRGITRGLPHLSDRGMGVHRSLPHLSDRGQFIHEWFCSIAEHLRDVRVCCGDWSRVCGRTPTERIGLTGVFLDPPYTAEDRDKVYNEDSYSVAKDVEKWCKLNERNKKVWIALCGYDGDYDLPDWDKVPWKAKNGYCSSNGYRERIWFSPSMPHVCDGQMSLLTNRAGVEND